MVKQQNNPVISSYKDKYGLADGLVSKIINTFGDCKYSHNFCKFIVDLKKNSNLQKFSFEELINLFETGDIRPVIENKLNFD